MGLLQPESNDGKKRHHFTQTPTQTTYWYFQHCTSCACTSCRSIAHRSASRAARKDPSQNCRGQNTGLDRILRCLIRFVRDHRHTRHRDQHQRLRSRARLAFFWYSSSLPEGTLSCRALPTRARSFVWSDSPPARNLENLVLFSPWSWSWTLLLQGTRETMYVSVSGWRFFGDNYD